MRRLHASPSASDDAPGDGHNPDGATGADGDTRRRATDVRDGPRDDAADQGGPLAFLSRDPHGDAEFLLLVAGSLLSILAALALAMLL